MTSNPRPRQNAGCPFRLAQRPWWGRPPVRDRRHHCLSLPSRISPWTMCVEVINPSSRKIPISYRLMPLALPALLRTEMEIETMPAHHGRPSALPHPRATRPFRCPPAFLAATWANSYAKDGVFQRAKATVLRAARLYSSDPRARRLNRNSSRLLQVQTEQEQDQPSWWEARW